VRWPDIQRAGRTILRVDEKVPDSKLLQLANLKAYAGSEEFNAA
jgi:hypothetical protein